MLLSPERPSSPPLLFRRAAKEQPDLPILPARRRSFDGGSMVLAGTPEESASDARAKAEAEQWQQQLEAAQNMPAAGSSSLVMNTAPTNKHGLGLPNGQSSPTKSR